MKDLTAKARELDQAFIDNQKQALSKDWLRSADAEDLRQYTVALMNVNRKIDTAESLAVKVLMEEKKSKEEEK